MSREFDLSDRMLLESAASAIYRKAVELGGISDDDPALTGSAEAKAAHDLLVDLGLLVWRENTGTFVPEDPTMVQSSVVAPLGQRGAELITESARWADSFAALSQAYRRSPQREETPVVELRGQTAINNFIRVTLGDCRNELLTAQPHGRRPVAILADAVQRDVETLKRGVTMRTLYQHSARHSTATREYVMKVSAYGAEIRTLDEFFNRLIVIDRHVAIVPGEQGDQMALAIYQRGLIAYLVDIFERAWERALPFTDTADQADRDIAEDVRRMTIRMLTEGHSDAASAKRVGVSARTYASYIAALKEEYGVQTRFQLGHAMGRESVENPPPDT